MKIRIKGNSVRLRLSQSEVQHFSKEGVITECIVFGVLPSERLFYSLQKSTMTQLTARMKNNEVLISMPEQIAKEWTETDLVGVENEVNIGQRLALKILIEKDFKCLTTRVGEDESDNFPHPKVGETEC